MTPTLIRFATENDLPFIFNSWLKSHRDIFRQENLDGSEFSPKDKKLRELMRDRHDETKFMKNASYYSSYKKHITKLIERSKVTLAVDPAKPEMILGYLVSEKLTATALVCHFAYTKHVFRKLGVLKKLLIEANLGKAPEAVIVTLHNLTVSELRTRFPDLIVYDPHILE